MSGESRSCLASRDGSLLLSAALFVEAQSAFAVVLLTFFLTGHVAAGPLVASTHLTVRRRSSQSVICSGGNWKAILATLHFTGCILKATMTSDFKVTVMSLAQPAWRCPTYGEPESQDQTGITSKGRTDSKRIDVVSSCARNLHLTVYLSEV